jgi:hypothetical protein
MESRELSSAQPASAATKISASVEVPLIQGLTDVAHPKI